MPIFYAKKSVNKINKKYKKINTLLLTKHKKRIRIFKTYNKGGDIVRTRLKVLRIQKGWSQKEASEKLGLSAAAYSFIETGRRFGSNKTWEKIKKLYSLSDKEVWNVQHEN